MAADATPLRAFLANGVLPFLLLLTGGHALALDIVTGRQEPMLVPDAPAAQPMLRPLRQCESEVRNAARDAAAVPKGRAPSAMAHAQAVKECEAANATSEALNAIERERVRKQNASRAADAERAKVRVEEQRIMFEAEEKEVARLLQRWLPKVEGSYRPDALALLPDNPHLLLGSVIAGPMRLVRRLSPDSALATHGGAYMRIDGMPPDLALYSERPFVLIGKVVEVVPLEPAAPLTSPVARIQWIDGGDCALTASASRAAAQRCLPWLGLRHKLTRQPG